MKINSIEWQYVSDDSDDSDDSMKMCCPICSKTWIFVLDEYSTSYLRPCDHLRFVTGYSEEIEYFGNWDFVSFQQAYREAYQKTFEKHNLDDPDDMDDIGVYDLEMDVLQEMNFKEIDTVYKYYDSGPAAGQDFQMLFGVNKKGNLLGRPKRSGKSRLDQFQPEIYALLKNGKPKTFIAKRYGTSLSNLNKWMKKKGYKRAKIGDTGKYFYYLPSDFKNNDESV